MFLLPIPDMPVSADNSNDIAEDSDIEIIFIGRNSGNLKI
jgi:hypothetical protein